MTRVAIIDCGAGNLHSVRKAFACQLPEEATLDIVTEVRALREASHIVLPGVGAFADCMAGLQALPGMRAALEEAVLKNKTPFFGICVGMQMLFQRGHEHGEQEGLGWFQGEVRKIAPRDPELKIPHMGWNRLHIHSPRKRGEKEGGTGVAIHSGASEVEPPFPHPTSPACGGGAEALKGIEDGAYFYFVHSFAATGCKAEEVLATVDYGGEIVALIGRENILASQFHPEKSQTAGLRLIRNFLAMSTP